MSISDANITEGSEILDIYGKAVINGIETAHGKCVFIGESRYSIICRKEEDIYSTELRVPFKYELDSTGISDCSRENIAVACALDNRRARIDCDGDTFMLDAEIRMSGIVFGESEISKVSEVFAGEAIERRSSDIIVCYPTSDESVWSVAKKYLVEPSKVSGDPATDRYCIIQM